MARLALVGIGGNSLIKDPVRCGPKHQWQMVCETATHIAAMVTTGWNIVITHGNGPQLGFASLRSELAEPVLQRLPLDLCGADVQGELGYMIQQALHNEFRRRGIQRRAIALVTQVLVDPTDPAFHHPTKPIGLFYTEERARALQAERGWVMMEDAGRGWRQVVPSPLPKAIIERDAILTLVEAGFIVIAAGGGGIPVVDDGQGNLHGVEAAVDKDLTGSMLATEINADLLLLSTAIERVALDFGKPEQRDLPRLTAKEAVHYLGTGQFAPGSMEPKVRAAVQFLEHGGQAAMITSPDSIQRALGGKTGTWIVPNEASEWPYVSAPADYQFIA